MVPRLSLSICPVFCRYLLEQKANVAAVNNDGDLAIDICEDNEMRKILQEEMDNQGRYPAGNRQNGGGEETFVWFPGQIYIYFCHLIGQHFPWLVKASGKVVLLTLCIV